MRKEEAKADITGKLSPTRVRFIERKRNSEMDSKE